MTGLTRDDLSVGLRFLAALPRFLRTPSTVDSMRAEVRDRFARRDARFLAAVDLALAIPGSPYARLFAHAGVASGDLPGLVRRDGVERTLVTLYRAGVYLACDEFKSRKAVVRGSLRFDVDPASLVNPRSAVHGLAETSGSGGARTPVPIDLAFVRDHAVNTHLALDAHGGRDWIHAHHGVPGGTAVTNPLEFAKGGRPPERWFTPIDVAASGLAPRYRFGSMAMRLAGRLAGVPLPGPTLAPFAAPASVLRWIAEVRARGGTPHLWTFASTAVHICEAAIATGADIRGTRFTMGGEPTTRARRALVESAGAVALPRMGATETDILAYACASPGAPDDMHFLDDRHALVQPGAGGEAPGLPPDAMLLTSLLESAPLRLVNVCLGDRATVSTGACGCGLERDGWRTHLRDVRSFEKMTAGGITFLDVDLVRVLEDAMPRAFGGRAGDWQLVERVDSADARPEVSLVVDPAVGPLDDRRVTEAFLDAIGAGDGGERLMALQWRDGDVLRVVRGPPRRTGNGKAPHVFHER